MDFRWASPKKTHEFAVRLEVVLGFRKPAAKKGFTNFAMGKNRRFSCMARRVELGTERDGLRRTLGSTDLDSNVPAMADALAIDFLRSRKVFKRLSPTNRLVAFKNAVEKDNFPISFNPLALYLRCLKLLQRIHTYCHENAPIDYPREEFEGGLSMNAIILDIFVNLGRPIFHSSMFPIAVKFLREMIETEGDAESTDARAQQAKSMLARTQANPETEPDFENPEEDMISLETRKLPAHFMLQGKDGNLRMPFN